MRHKVLIAILAQIPFLVGFFGFESQAKSPAKELPELKSQSATIDTSVPRSAPAKTHILFGRVEQLTSQPGAQFPLLSTPSANLALERPGADDGTLYTGKIVNSFPENSQGLWHGTLRLMQSDFSEAARSMPQSQLCKVGMVGQTNIRFQRANGKLQLAPVNIVFQVPVTNGAYSNLVNAPGASEQGSQRHQNRQTSLEFVVSLGDIKGATFAGGQIQARTMTNSTREVAESTFEQDSLVAQTFEAPGKPSQEGYCENAIRFRRMNATQQYVEAVMVNYDDRRQLIMKMIFAGYIQKARTR